MCDETTLLTSKIRVSCNRHRRSPTLSPIPIHEESYDYDGYDGTA
jgi:hypothetical protein